MGDTKPSLKKRPATTPSTQSITDVDSTTLSALENREHPTKHNMIDALSSVSEHLKVAIRLRPIVPQKTRKRRLLRGRSDKQTNSSDWEPAWSILPHPDDDNDAPVVLTQTMCGGGGGEHKQKQHPKNQQQRPLPGGNMFSFDHIFDAQQSTLHVYRAVTKPIVDAVVTGRHGTILAYGATGSGKTYTMQGDDDNDDNNNNSAGIVQMAATDILEQMNNDHVREYVLTAEFLEIYNERVRNLLSNDDHDDDDNVDDNANQPHRIETAQDVTSLLRLGHSRRAQAATNRNAQSSRSHAIFRLTLESWEAASPSVDTPVLRSVLNLVDLAGSENSAQSGVTGLRKKEAGKINQSLLALSRVVYALSLPAKKRPKHIGYRDSKLTRILQPHLSGNACLAVLCCISPARIHLEQTRSTLKFAASAKRITVQPQINQVQDQTQLILALQKELKETKEVLYKLQSEEVVRSPPPREVVLLSNPQETPALPPRDASSHEDSGRSFRIGQLSISYDEALNGDAGSPGRPIASGTLELDVREQEDDLVVASIDDDDDDDSSTAHSQTDEEDLVVASIDSTTATSQDAASAPLGDQEEDLVVASIDSTVDSPTEALSMDDSQSAVDENVVVASIDSSTSSKNNPREPSSDDAGGSSSVAESKASAQVEVSLGDAPSYDEKAHDVQELLARRKDVERKRATPPPIGEVLVLSDSPKSQGRRDVASRLEEAEEQVTFLSNKLDATYDLVDNTKKLLQGLQVRHVELGTRNMELEVLVSKYQDTENSQSEEMEVLMQQFHLMKYALVVGVLFSFGGRGELLIVAMVVFLWFSRIDPSSEAASPKAADEVVEDK